MAMSRGRRVDPDIAEIVEPLTSPWASMTRSTESPLPTDEEFAVGQAGWIVVKLLGSKWRPADDAAAGFIDFRPEEPIDSVGVEP